MSKETSGFHFSRFSDLAYQQMTVEIGFGSAQVCQLTMEQGPDGIEVVLFNEFAFQQPDLVFPLEQFMETLERASEALRESYDPKAT